jgi:hypothetical protein
MPCLANFGQIILYGGRLMFLPTIRAVHNTTDTAKYLESLILCNTNNTDTSIAIP